jgi:serine/threonine-protein kinase HipA
VSTVAEVVLWGRTIGAVAVDGPGQAATFEYVEAFQDSGIEVAPLVMPLARRTYRFADLPFGSFHGLPGLLSDSLLDKFGNAVIDAWLAAQGRLPQDLDAVERLCYTGSRGMGALEFRPARGPRETSSTPVRIDALVELASTVLQQREALHTTLAHPEQEQALREILRVGASAGGARAKAVIAWNPVTHEVRSGQVNAPAGFEYWLLKFDGVAHDTDRDLAHPKGFGAIELAYASMARAAGIDISDCRLLEEGGRRHFMTRRFDRRPDGEKVHMQSLAALAHFDFNDPLAHSYEQALLVIRRLGLSIDAVEQQFRRMVFNVVARNQDDHVKNIAFLMDKQGRWSLSPAYDVTYAYNPDGAWTSRHQMALAGKRDGFTFADLQQVASTASMQRGRAAAITREVLDAVARWPEFATAASVARKQLAAIGRTHRLDLAPPRR